MANWTAIWSGEYPCLCSGEWKLYKDGVEVDVEIPFKNEPANTEGTYEDWAFDENFSEYFWQYCDGLTCEKWITAYKYFLRKLADSSEWPDIYKAFQKSDWRHHSCGGCI